MIGESLNSSWAHIIEECIMRMREISSDIGDYIDSLTPKVSFNASVFTGSRPSSIERRRIKDYERSIMRSLNAIKHIISGLQSRDMDTIDPFTEITLADQLEIVKSPPNEIQELKDLIAKLKTRKLDVFDAESVYTAYRTAYEVFSTTLNKQITHYNETYQGKMQQTMKKQLKIFSATLAMP